MKKLILIACVCKGLSTSTVQAQSADKAVLSFCNATKDKDTINSRDFDTCLELILIDTKFKLISYTITYSGEIGYNEYSVYGSNADKKTVVGLKKSKPKKILIEQVKATNNVGIVKKYPGLVLYVNYPKN